VKDIPLLYGADRREKKENRHSQSYHRDNVEAQIVECFECRRVPKIGDVVFMFGYVSSQKAGHENITLLLAEE